MCATLEPTVARARPPSSTKYSAAIEREERNHRRSGDAEDFCRRATPATADVSWSSSEVEPEQDEGVEDVRDVRAGGLAQRDLGAGDVQNLFDRPLRLTGQTSHAGQPVQRILGRSQAVGDFGQRLISGNADSCRIRAHGAAAVEPRRELLEPVALDELEILLADAPLPRDGRQRQPPALPRQPQPFV